MADELREKLRAVGKRCLDTALFAQTADGRILAEALVELSSCVEMVFERVARVERRRDE